MIVAADDFRGQPELAGGRGHESESGQMAVERETWIRVRGASSWVPARFATLAVIAACRRSQIISMPPARRVNAAADEPFRISS